VIARRLARDGMRVIVVDVDGAAAERVASELGGAMAVVADLSRDAGATSVIDAIGDEVDVLVNCAGGWSPSGRGYPDTTPEQWDAVPTLNLRTPMRLLQAWRGALARSPVGAAVSISSSAARDAGAYGSPARSPG
jgi:NAD(P)-dependent dehydrogenase (short-subunit alcohol dehydrogenase family)